MRFLAAVIAVSAVLVSQAAEAQMVVTYAVPHVVHYAPVPIVLRTVTTSRPVFAPAAAFGYGPGLNIRPSYIDPATVVTRAVVAQPVVTSRYRPVLGGTVYRARYHYGPANIVVTPY